MKIRCALLQAILPVFLISVTAQAAEVAGVKLDDKMRVTATGPELVLNGAGLRTRIMFKVYVAGLYLTDKKGSATDVLALKGPKRVLLSTLRDLSAAQLVDALNDGMRDNSSAADLERLKPQIDALNAIMLAVKETAKGSTIAFDFIPDSGTLLTVNGEVKGAPIAGEDFYAAVLKIWIGEKPVEDGLKKALLGATQ